MFGLRVRSLRSPVTSDEPRATTTQLPALNAILDADAAARAGWTLPDLAEACVAGGARWLQIRAKTIAGAEFLDLASRLREIAHASGAILVVNDRADIARLAGADGVHVGQDDLSPAAARAVLGTAAIVGFSTHTEAQIDAAIALPVSYIAVGPVFGTATKDTGYTNVGLDRVRYAAAAVGRSVSSEEQRPRGVVAIGGITLDSAADVVRSGAMAVAVIADLLATGDPESRVRAYLMRLAESAGYNPRGF
jgi:thiamine-phosphate pyrophosphorylase